MDKDKRANVQKGSSVLRPLQSDEEFNKVTTAQNWAVTQTDESNILIFDCDTNNLNPKLKKFFNRRRDKYINHSELINSKHGFLKVIDADHEWCKLFAERYHLKSGIEIYAEKHFVVFAGSYYNTKNLDDPKRETTWYPLDDLHLNPIIEITKDDLAIAFSGIASNQTDAKKSVKELHDENFVKTEGQNRGEDLLRVIDSWKIKNPELTESMLFLMAMQYNNDHFMPPYPEDKIKALVKQGFEYGIKKIEERQQEETNESEKKVSKSKGIIDDTAKMIKDNHYFVTMRKTEEILSYNGKIYSDFDAKSIIKEESEKIIESCTEHDRNEVLNKIKAQTYQSIEDFDKDPKKLTLVNGILDFDTLEIMPHTPDNLSRVLLPVEYQEPEFEIKEETIFEDIEKNLKDTMFWKFLKSSFSVVDQNYNVIEFRENEFQTVLEITASFFVKHQIDEKAFMFLGRGENGKSVLLEYIEGLIGKDNKESIPLQLLAHDKFMASKLVGKLANIFPDLESDELKHTGILKAIISGEGLTVQEKYKNPFNLYPFSKMLFSCNRFPKVEDQTQGFFRRWMIVKWERNFEKDPCRDEHLKDKLRENQDEKNKVFSCLIYLTRKLFKDGKFSHSKDWKTIRSEWNSNADPLDDFVNKCISDSEENEPVITTYKHYKLFMESKQETPLGIAQFGRAFKEYFDQIIEKQEKIPKRVWVGIKSRELRLDEF